MSLYNMINGVNETAPFLLMCAGFKPEIMEFPRIRFRDCYASPDGKEIIIYTRIGGGNRGAHAETIKKLQNLPNYVRDEDDSFDSTFASFYFSPCVPEAAELLAEIYRDGKSGSERPAKIRAMMDDMVAGRETPAVAAAMEAMKPIAEGLKSALEGGASSVDISDVKGHGVQIFTPGVKPVREEVPDAVDPDA